MFKPINNHLVVRKPEETKKLDSGIIIPDMAEEEKIDKVVIHEVVASGSELAKEGDFVAYANWSGTKYQEDGVDYVVLRQEDLYGVVKKVEFIEGGPNLVPVRVELLDKLD